MKLSDFRNEVKNSYAKYFDGSYIGIRFDPHSIYKNVKIGCYLVKDENEAINHITSNDMFRISFSLTKSSGEFDKSDIVDENLILSDDLILEKWDFSYTVKPDNKYMVYGSKGITFRKVKGTPEKMIETLDKYFKKLNEQLHDDIKNDLIHNHHIELLKKRLV